MDYNGFTNRATWSVALNIGNIESLYLVAKNCTTYNEFLDASGMRNHKTTENISYIDPELNTSELDEVINELD